EIRFAPRRELLASGSAFEPDVTGGARHGGVSNKIVGQTMPKTYVQRMSKTWGWSPGKPQRAGGIYSKGFPAPIPAPWKAVERSDARTLPKTASRRNARKRRFLLSSQRPALLMAGLTFGSVQGPFPNFSSCCIFLTSRSISRQVSHST